MVRLLFDCANLDTSPEDALRLEASNWHVVCDATPLVEEWSAPEKWSSLMYGLWPDGGLKALN